jgi:hypothetical protein
VANNWPNFGKNLSNFAASSLPQQRATLQDVQTKGECAYKLWGVATSPKISDAYFLVVSEKEPFEVSFIRNPRAGNLRMKLRFTVQHTSRNGGHGLLIPEFVGIDA